MHKEKANTLSGLSASDAIEAICEDGSLARASVLERERDAWKECCAMESRNKDFYRGLIEQIAEPFGVRARTSDDGSVQDSALALKMPQLVAEMFSWCSRFRDAASAMLLTMESSQRATVAREVERVLRDFERSTGDSRGDDSWIRLGTVKDSG